MRRTAADEAPPPADTFYEALPTATEAARAEALRSVRLLAAANLDRHARHCVPRLKGFSVRETEVMVKLAREGPTLDTIMAVHADDVCDAPPPAGAAAVRSRTSSSSSGSGRRGEAPPVTAVCGNKLRDWVRPLLLLLRRPAIRASPRSLFARAVTAAAAA